MVQSVNNIKKIICVGGGHCNCQVLKLIKQLSATSTCKVSLTLVNEAPKSYYSGMLPGTISQLYKNEDLQVEMAPLAKWCNADYYEKQVSKVVGKESRIELTDGTSLEYDALILNIGSKT